MIFLMIFVSKFSQVIVEAILNLDKNVIIV